LLHDGVAVVEVLDEELDVKTSRDLPTVVVICHARILLDHPWVLSG
jgi:hypothetical protein